MITLLLKSSIVIILLLAFYKLFLEKESFFAINRVYLMACLMMAGLLPSVTLPELVQHQGIVEIAIQPIIPQKPSQVAKETSKEKIKSLPVEQEAFPEIVQVPTKEPTPTTNITKKTPEKFQAEITQKEVSTNTFTHTLQAFSISDWLLLFYLFGVLILLLNLVAQLSGIAFRIIKNTDKIKDDDGIIVNMNAIIEPCSFFNYIFINPASYDFDTYEQIIAHEKIHVQKGHTFDLLIAELAVIVLWFNPFIWLFRKEVEKNIEYQTDALLIKNAPKQKEGYQMNLLKIATYNKPLTVVTNYNQSLIKQRILKMNSKQSTPYSYWKYAFLMPLLLVTVLILNKPLMFANDNHSAFSTIENTTLNKPVLEEAPLEKEVTTSINELLSTEKKTIPPNVPEKNSVSNKIEESEALAPSISKQSDCEKLLQAVESGDLDKVRNILSTFNPGCMPYANNDDYKNIKRINKIAKSGGQILLDTENELIIIEGRRILLSNHSYDLPSDFGNEIKDDCAGMQKALVKGDTKTVKEILMNMDKDCIEDADNPDEVADLMLTQKILRNGGRISISTSRMTIDWDELASKEMNGKVGFHQQKPKELEVNISNDTYKTNETSDCKTLLEAISTNDLTKVKTLLKTIDSNCLEQNPGYETRAIENGMTWRRIKPQTPLVAAARAGNLAIGKLLVEAGAKVDFYGKRNEPPLIAAAEIGATEFTKFLLAKGADLSYNSNAYGSALNAAARGGHTETMTFLLKAGADIDATTNGQGTPLNAAARHGHLAVMKLLIENGANINSQNNGQGSALNAAARHGYIKAVKLLLENGAAINQQNNGQGSALNAAARHGHIDVVKLLLANEADIDAKTNGQGSALNAAARHGHLDVIELLIAKGADLDATTNGQGSALNTAARHGQLEIVQLLLEKGANIDQQTNGQGSALNAAARHGHLEIVQFLLEKGANIDQQNNGQGSALNAATRHGHLKIARLLIEKGADINAQTNGQGSALNAAARHGQIDIVQLLIGKGADINAQTNGQGSALNAAARHGNLEIAKFLLAKGANVNQMNNGQGTALIQATKNNDYKMVELLLKYGADPYLNPNSQKSPITYAYDAGNERMVDLLKSNAK